MIGAPRRWAEVADEGSPHLRRSVLRTVLTVPYRWKLVAVLAVTQLVSWGVLFHAFTVFQDPMRAELGLSVAEISGAFTIAVLAKGAAGLPVGHWVDRHGARGVMTVGSLGAVASVLAWSRVSTRLELYLVFAAVGVSSAAVFYEPAFATVVRWFNKERATAILAITLVAGHAPTVFAPLSNMLIEARGWRTALLVLAAVLAAVTVLPHALILHSAPVEVSPDPGGPAPSVDPGPARHLWATFASAARDQRFRWFTLSFAANTFAVAVVTVHLVPYLRASGQSGSAAVTALAALGLLSVAGRIGLTLAARRWQMRQATAGSFLTRTVAAMALLALPGNTLAVVGFVVAFGFSAGIGTIGKATLLADAFGTASYAGRTAGLNIVLTGVRAFAPLVAGLVITATASRAVVPAVVAVTGVLGAAAVLRSGRDGQSGADAQPWAHRRR